MPSKSKSVISVMLVISLMFGLVQIGSLGLPSAAQAAPDTSTMNSTDGTTDQSTTAGRPAVLKKLQYNGIDIKGFIPGNNIPDNSIVSYNVELPIGTTAIPVITAESDTGHATITIGNAVSLPGTTTIDVTENGITNKYPIHFTVAEAPQAAYYYQNYNEAAVADWTDYDGTSTTPINTGKAVPSIVNGSLQISVPTAGNHYVLDNGYTNAPADALYHAKVRVTGPTANNIRFGLGVRGTDGKNIGMVNFEPGSDGTTRAIWHARVSGTAKNPGNLFADGLDFKPNVVYDIKIQVVGQNVTLFIDGTRIGEATIKESDMPIYTPPADSPANYGRFAIKTWGTAETVYLDDLYIADPVGDIIPPVTNNRVAPDPTAYKTISSASMKVLIGTDFPFVYKYKDQEGNSLANGIRESDAEKLLNINGENVPVTSELKSISADSAVYELHAKDDANQLEALFTVILKVTGNKLRMEFSQIVEQQGTVRTFFIPNHNMLSVQGAGAGVAVGQLTGWGPMGDYFASTDELTTTNTVAAASYAMLYDSAYSQAIENNALDGKKKFLVREFVNPADPGDKFISLTNNAWYWHYLDGVPLDEDYVPFAQVAVGGDENGDGAISWEDAGLMYRSIANRAYGSEDVKNNWMYIAMNMSSQNSNPFVRVLDHGKAISYLTDGFGQKVMIKGYQAGGHDDSHGDYDNIGAQQGGAADFNYLNTVGKQYNMKTGIHINTTEFPLDGFDTKLENMSRNGSGGLMNNWNWLDQAWLVDKTKDIQSGELKRRLDLLKETVPDLSFVYVDVYQSGSGYNAKQLAKYINDNGWSLGTEAAGDLEEALTFVHWNTDLYYPAGGGQSQIIRFVHNDWSDRFAPDKALLGELMPGISDWRNTNKFSDAQDIFYRQNLPTKYLQHFTLRQWTPNESASFSNEVKSIVTSENGKDYTSIYKDGSLVAKLDVSAVLMDYGSKPQPSTPGKAKIFIPWDPAKEEKIYYYNDYEQSSTWTVPKSWAGVSKVYQYKLTPNGRELVAIVEVAGDQVSLNGDLSTPYVLTKVEDALGSLPSAEGTWGQGSKIKNFGFTSETLEGWDTEIATDDPAGIQVVTRSGNEGMYNNPFVSFATGTTGAISQTMTGLTPGKTYSLSAWTRSDDRPVTLGVLLDGQRYESSLATTAGIPIMIRPSKYNGKSYQRLKVDFTVPAGATSAKVYFRATAGTGSQAVYLDDFRIWEWPNAKTSYSNAYLLHEDFENVDENWGPFISQVSSQPYIHLTELNTDSNEQKQIKAYTIDGKVSLKDQQTGSGVHMRTLPSTLNLDAKRSYTVSFEYQAYREMRTADEYTSGPVSYSAENNGFTVPQSETMYTIELRNAGGTVISSLDLAPSSVAAPYSYNSAVTAKTATLIVPADGIAGKYLTISKKASSRDDMLVIDNFFVLDNNSGESTTPDQNPQLEPSPDSTPDRNYELATTAVRPVIHYPDVKGHWAEQEIQTAYSYGIVSGYPNGKFQPNKVTTNAEAFVMFGRAINFGPVTSAELDAASRYFADWESVPAWAKDNIAVLYGKGILKGIAESDGKVYIRPDREITRAQFVTMIDRAGVIKDLSAGEKPSYLDNEDIPDWASASFMNLTQAGIVIGDDRNRANPNASATRAETVVLLMRVIEAARKGEKIA